MATNFGIKLPTPSSFVASVFRNGLKDHNFDFKIFKNIKWQWFLYIACKFGNIQSSARLNFVQQASISTRLV